MTYAGRSRRALSAIAVCMFVASGGLACSEAEEAPASPPSTSLPSSPEEPAPEQPQGPGPRLEVVALPPIVQPGEQPSTIDRASRLVVVGVRPASPGEVVRLESPRDGQWRTVATARQDRSGHVTFTGLPAVTSDPYRAVVGPEGGEVTSTTVESPAWTAVFGDDFDGLGLDPSRWSYRQLGLYNPEGDRTCSKSHPSAVGVADGTLRLLVRSDPERVGERCRSAYGTHDYYLNGHVSTERKFAFTYGVAAARVRFQEGRGQHGAFWLQRLGGEQVPGDAERSGAEIDVVEFFGEGYPEGGLSSSVYYLNKHEKDEKVGGLHPEATEELPPGDDWWSSYHVFSVEWTPRHYVFRVDGREMFRTSEAVSGVDEFLVLSLLSSDWELDRLDRSTLPSRMDVDWVRVWQRADG